MTMPRPLPAERLRAWLDPAKLPCDDSTVIALNGKPSDTQPKAQPRALDAMQLGLAINDRGYNIYLCGEANLGRTYLVRDFLTPHAKKRPTPPDLIYVTNFDDVDKPRLISLPPGGGKLLKQELAQAFTRIKRDIPAKFEHETYFNRRKAITDGLQIARDELLEQMAQDASSQGFNLDIDDEGGYTIYPLMEGKVLSQDEYQRLDPTTRKAIKQRSDTLMHAMNGHMRKMFLEERDVREQERTLDEDTLREVLAEHLHPLRDRLKKEWKNKELDDFFEGIERDVIENLDLVAPRDSAAQERPPQAGGVAGSLGFDGLPPSLEDFFLRYEINVFVDNADTQGAPVIIEDHPTLSNLLGCVEREAEMGALVADFSLIKSGAIHKAQGGFLVLHVEDILQHAGAWEGLLRALRSGLAKIEDPAEQHETTRTKTIEPEPLVLDVKVVLIGGDEAYEALLHHDDRFHKFFKVKAHLQERIPRDGKSIKQYLASLARIIHEANLLPFDRHALAQLVDYGSVLAEDQRKLSLKLPLLRERMLEASALARMDGARMVDGAILARAIQAKEYRSNLYEEEFMEEYDRELIKVSTSGSRVGTVNGLSVTWYGDYEIGLPHQISATVGVGHGGIVDLEREAELGGPIHTKAMMILKSYLVSLFAQDKPLVLTGSLCFEQSYAHVEGDSASGAELAALLSALSGAPLNLSLAFTGAVSQSGGILAVGGVTRKVEGFFKVCKRRGLTGEQGVLLPADNIVHLMLSEEVLEAVRAGAFHVYPVSSIEDALELLTGIPAGKPRKDGGFTRDSLYDRVDKRLAALAKMAREYESRR
ncbi:Lon protease family protein [Megalodesulfovibrio paquesii]